MKTLRLGLAQINLGNNFYTIGKEGVGVVNVDTTLAFGGSTAATVAVLTGASGAFKTGAGRVGPFVLVSAGFSGAQCAKDVL